MRNLKATKKNEKYISSLPKIYLIACWARYGVREFPFTKQVDEHSVPIVYDFDDHNGTYAEYIARPITQTTTGSIATWCYNEQTARFIADLLNIEHGFECIYNDDKTTPVYMDIINLINTQSQNNYENYIKLLKENQQLKEHIKDLENEQIAEMKEHQAFCKLAKETIDKLLK